MSSNNTQKEKSFLEIFYIVYRGKTIIISSVFLFLILAFLYNQSSTPVFESKALLKKENVDSRGGEVYELFRLQTLDRINTEKELIKTEDVLGRVIDELKLRVELKEIIDPIGNSYELNNVFIDFPDSGNSYAKQISFSLPIFKNVELKSKNVQKELYIEKKGENIFELKEVEENKLILTSKTSLVNEIDTLNDFNSTTIIDSITTLDIHPIGSIFRNYYEFLKRFRKSIYITGVGNTDMFTLNVRSSSPLACKIIANNIIHSFKEARMELQKQTVRYSFQFVDEQLTEVQTKLLNAESNLSSFKVSGQIMTIDASTQELMNYLSTLEAEKLQTDLLISNYKIKAEAMRKELQESGYFDQSFLEPEPSGEYQYQSNSPFSTLMTHLSDLELQKLELLQKRTENHPDVINLNEQIRLAEDKLADYNQNTLTAYRIITNTLEKKLLKNIFHQ